MESNHTVISDFRFWGNKNKVELSFELRLLRSLILIFTKVILDTSRFGLCILMKQINKSRYYNPQMSALDQRSMLNASPQSHLLFLQSLRLLMF